MEIKTIQNKIQKYTKYKEQADKIYDELEEFLLNKAIEVLKWENENIGKRHDICCDTAYYSYDLDIMKDYISLEVNISWSYGGHDCEYHTIPYFKLFSDDWKQLAIEEYKKQLTKELEEQKKKIEEKERKEYERLKQKYESK